MNKDILIEHGSEDYTEENINFEYLLRLPIYSLTSDEINKLTKEFTKLNTEYSELDNQSISDIWIEELDLFLKMYKRMK